MDYELAKKTYMSQGSDNKYVKEFNFPYNFLHENDKFIEVTVLVDLIKTQGIFEDKVAEYKKLIEEGVDVGLPWLSFGKRLTTEVIPHWHMMFYALDGNHRITASKELGIQQIKVIMPDTHYELYERINYEQNSKSKK